MRHHPSRSSGAPSLLVGATVAVLAAVVAVGPATPAFGEETPSPSAGASPGAEANPNIGPATPGEAVCTLAGTALNAVSGMAATETGFVVVESEDLDQVRLYTLDPDCKSTPKNYSVGNPLDPEDLAVASDGTIVIAETGDDDESRDTIAVFKIAPGSSTANIFRMTYPDGKHDAEAMLLDKGDVPIIITRSGSGGKSGIYRPAKALVPNTRTNLPVLEKIGEFAPLKTGTSNPLLAPGQTFVTGAAKSPDGSKVVIRTYSDAYEWDVTDGDVVAAITSTNYRVTPLPDEPQGEAITYDAEGKNFLTLSLKPEGATENPKLLRYQPFVPAAAPTGDPADNLPPAPGENKSWFDKLTFSDLTRLVAAVGVVGLVLAIAGIVGIRRARRRRREEEEYDDYDDYDDEPPRRGRGGRGRSREDEHSFAGLRESRYQDGYGGYGDNGFAARSDNGYGAAGGGYADAGYGAGYAGGSQYGAGQQYGGADPYGGGQYGADQYAGGQQHGGQQYADPYGGQQQYSDQQYGGQQYGAGQYGEQDGYGHYGAGQDNGGQYGGQHYGAQYGQSYPGYGYEDDFDPLQDPRRR